MSHLVGYYYASRSEPSLDPPDSERAPTLPERLAWLRRNPDAEPDDMGEGDL